MSYLNNPNVFAPEAIASINRAYVKACDRLTSDRAQEKLRFKVAEYIMSLAKAGETNEDCLCDQAVSAVLSGYPR